jgi:hypothetical protein
MYRDILDSEIGIAQAYQLRITDAIGVGHRQRTFYKAYPLLAFLLSLPKQEILHSKYSITKSSNPG